MTYSLPTQPRHQIIKSSWRALVFGLAIGFAAPSFADNLPDVQRLIKQAQYPQALEKVDAYLSSRPKDAQGRFLKGLILTEMGKQADAIVIFTKLTEDYPELPEPYNNLAVLYAQQKQYDKARTSLEMAIRTHPSYAIAYENLGDIYAKLASQAYDKALQLDSANATTQTKLALIRDLISTSAKPNVKPQAPATAPVAVAPAAPTPTVAAKPATPPTANVLSATQGSAATTSVPTSIPKAPEAKPAAPTTNDEIAKAISAWADAWSRKDMKAYVAAYTNDFKGNNSSRRDWEEERTQRIAGKGGKIVVSVGEPRIEINGDKAIAKFRQSYKATGMSTSTRKTLSMVRVGGRWLIQEENSR